MVSSGQEHFQFYLGKMDISILGGLGGFLCCLGGCVGFQDIQEWPGSHKLAFYFGKMYIFHAPGDAQDLSKWPQDDPKTVQDGAQRIHKTCQKTTITCI